MSLADEDIVSPGNRFTTAYCYDLQDGRAQIEITIWLANSIRAIRMKRVKHQYLLKVDTIAV